MNRLILLTVSLALGIGIGWYFGYTRPSVKNQRELLRQYHYVRDNFRMTDADMAAFADHRQEYFDAIKRTDEFAAALSLASLRRLDYGNINGTRNMLELTISAYYRGHRQDGDSNLIFHIDAYAATNASLSNAIHRKLE
jgi:hypothetical protein